MTIFAILKKLITTELDKYGFSLIITDKVSTSFAMMAPFLGTKESCFIASSTDKPRT